MSSSSPAGLLDRALLKQLAGDASYSRGEQYYGEQRVRRLQAGPDRASAKVEGTQPYRVKLWRTRNELRWSCTCPSGREDTFCKHAVAVGLAWLAAAQVAEENLAPTVRQEEERRRESLERLLLSLDRERLVTLLLEATDYDEILRRRLLLESIGVLDTGKRGKRSGRHGPTPDLAAYRKLIQEGIETHDYVDYEAMPDYAQGVEEVIQPLGDLLRSGQAAAAVELAEFALTELSKASEMLDGSDGSLNRVYDDLQRYHVEACRIARPDPMALAERLLAYELDGGLGVFNNAYKAYADVLGPEGQTAWRTLLTKAWAELPDLPVRGHERASIKPIDHRRFQVQALMESLAEEQGDVDMLIAVRQRDLSSVHDFLSLAELCRAKGRHEEALAWAERGLRELPAEADVSGLRELVVSELKWQGRYAEAAAMLWDDFARCSDLEHFRRLRPTEHDPASEWPAVRERALSHLRTQSKQKRRAAGKQRQGAAPDHSVIIEILWEEGLTDAAWREAQAGGCRPDLSLRLAATRESSHPEEILGFYQERLELTIARGDHAAYAAALQILAKTRRLMERLGRASEYVRYRDQMRSDHRKKRVFLKMLKAAEL